MDALRNAIRREAQALDRLMGHPRYGVVESYNPSDGTARITIQPDGTLSGWLPVAVHWLGNGWGMMCPPSPGDQVIVAPQGGDPEDLVVLGRVFSAQGGVTPPATPSGEFWIVHQSGSFVKLLNDGTISSKGTWAHDGDFRASGEVYRGYGGADQAGLGTHTHPDPQGGTTGAPNPGT